MFNKAVIERKVNKITLKELCLMFNIQNNQFNNIICSVKTNNDYRMFESNVDNYLHRKFEENSKILCKVKEK